MTIDQCLNLLAIRLVYLNDFSSFGPNQDSFLLLKVVKRAHASRELGHRHQVNDLLLRELSIPEDKFTVVATSDDQGPIVDVDNLPHGLCVCYDRLAQGPASPDLQLACGATSQHNFISESIFATDGRCDACLAIETTAHRQVDTVESEKFHMFDSTSGKLSLILPTGVKNCIWVHSRFAEHTFVSPVIYRN